MRAEKQECGRGRVCGEGPGPRGCSRWGPLSRTSQAPAKGPWATPLSRGPSHLLGLGSLGLLLGGCRSLQCVL